MGQNNLTKIKVFLLFSSYLTKICHRRTKMFDGGQTHRLVLSILNLEDQSEKYANIKDHFGQSN